MESLTRNNYEIWFLDYLDGQLDNEQLETLLDFLEQNPDLKEELREASGISLAAGMEPLDRKDQLLKTSSDIPGITAVDQLCIARMENDLPEAEAHLFDIRLNEDSGLERKYAAFLSTRLDPAEEVVYADKRDLLRKTWSLSPWIITAISSAAVILLAWFLWPDSKETFSPPLAKIETPEPDTQNLLTEPLRTSPETTQVNVKARNPIPETRNPKTIAPVSTKPAVVESSPREFVPMNALYRKPAGAGPRIPDPENRRVLLASGYPRPIDLPVNPKEALTVPQYAMQLFREKILGEDRAIVRKTRFSFWEVAGAGVDKINDLAGTKMKLNRAYDTQGDILAVSFNSRLLDVEAPVRGK